MLTAIAMGMLIGAVGEAGARLQRLWVYRKPIYPVLNVVVMFGVVMGTVATLATAVGWIGLFALGFGIGLAYELANLAYLDWWYFPNDRLFVLQGQRACAVAIAVAWGAVPVLVALVRGSW